MGRDGNNIETLLNEFDVAGITGLCVARGSLPTRILSHEGRI
jgi:hypothetical protein